MYVLKLKLFSYFPIFQKLINLFDFFFLQIQKWVTVASVRRYIIKDEDEKDISFFIFIASSYGASV